MSLSPSSTAYGEDGTVQGCWSWPACLRRSGVLVRRWHGQGDDEAGLRGLRLATARSWPPGDGVTKADLDRCEDQLGYPSS